MTAAPTHPTPLGAGGRTIGRTQISGKRTGCGLPVADNTLMVGLHQPSIATYQTIRLRPPMLVRDPRTLRDKSARQRVRATSTRLSGCCSFSVSASSRIGVVLKDRDVAFEIGLRQSDHCAGMRQLAGLDVFALRSPAEAGPRPRRRAMRTAPISPDGSWDYPGSRGHSLSQPGRLSPEGAGLSGGVRLHAAMSKTVVNPRDRYTGSP